MKLRFPDNQMITDAIEKLAEDTSIVKNNKIESKYSSYIASFGGSVIQVGITGTFMIFEANKEKQKVINILVNLFNEKNNNSLLKTTGSYFNTLTLMNGQQLKDFRNKMADAAVCLKLAMRFYEKIENSNE